MFIQCRKREGNETFEASERDCSDLYDGLERSSLIGSTERSGSGSITTAMSPVSNSVGPLNALLSVQNGPFVRCQEYRRARLVACEPRDVGHAKHA